MWEPFKHVLIVFGGVQGLEHSLKSDTALDKVGDPSWLFDMYLNVAPHQGSRTIRTEEALLVSMSVLSPFIRAYGIE